jgi:hypothetical protein
LYQFLRVIYEGKVVGEELIEGEECYYEYLYKVKMWDILLSNMGVGNMGVGRGAVDIVPPYHVGKYVSKEYTILSAQSKEEAVYYSNLLRIKEILGDILSSTTGMNRGRVKWNDVANVEVPEYSVRDKDIEQITLRLQEFWEAYKEFSNSKRNHMQAVVEKLDVDGEDAKLRWLAFKPPE